MLSWQPVENAMVYQIIKNGKVVDQTKTTGFKITPEKYAEYQVMAVDANGVTSFASEPIAVSHSEAQQYEMETFLAKANFTYKGFSGFGFVETSKTINSKLTIDVVVNESGLYAIDFRYSNGNGPTNTENKCAMRSLSANDKFIGTLVFPQRGVAEWSNWGYSNAVKVYLEKGKHTLRLAIDSVNENMNGEVNQAMLDYLRMTKLD